MLAAADGELAGTLDEDQTVLAAEVVFAIREEMARTLEDIVHRRLMIGLDADQGRPLYERIADIAGKELGWSEKEREGQLRDLVEYSDSLLVARQGGSYPGNRG